MMTPELDILTIEIPDDSITVLTPEDLPSIWHQFPAPTVLSDIGQKWIDDGKSLALIVPSSIIHSANNIILNCIHKDYEAIKIISQKKFYFDSRLLR